MRIGKAVRSLGKVLPLALLLGVALPGGILLTGCGGSDNLQVVRVTISPPTASVVTGGSVTFHAGVTGSANTGVSFSVSPGGGSVNTATGVYTASQTPGAYTVTATSQADPTKSASATVSVTSSGVSIGITPLQATVLSGQTASFHATVTAPGKVSTAVTYSVTPGGGAIDATGLYTAPAAPGTYSVFATSVADPTQIATATVTVPGVAVTISPQTVVLGPGGSQTFTSTVSGASSSGVIYSIQENTGGSANAGIINPLTGAYVAPIAPGTYHVVATSQANGSSTSTATVTVVGSTGLTVAVSPKGLTLNQGQSQVFQAVVTPPAGSPSTSQAVTWSVQGPAVPSATINGNTITVIAPSQAGSYTLLASSVADPTQSESSTFTVNAVALSVTPTAKSVFQGQTVQLVPTLTGAVNTGVTYTITQGGAGGSVSPTGLYTAPSVAATAVDVITVTSNADPTKTATVTITVSPPDTGTGTVVIQ